MNFSIGLSGLRAAQQALELVGTNLANASTEGYHRQDISLSPLQLGSGTSRVIIGGVTINGARRAYDVLMEREHFRQQPLLGQLEQELNGLYTIEAVMGQVDNNPLGESLREFFSALNDLAADPTSTAYTQQVVWTAESTAVNFRNMSNFLTDVKTQIREQAESFVTEVNTLAESVARLNSEIAAAKLRGATPNILLDQRDQSVYELANLADVSVSNLGGSDGNLNVTAWGTSLVIGSNFNQLKVGLDSNNKLGVTIVGHESYNTSSYGGKIGGMMNLHNEVVGGLTNKIDTLAQQVMYEFNAIQSQGIGTGGSFSSLSGTAVNTAHTMAQWQPSVSNGEVYLRLIDSSGVATTHAITVNSGDTLSDVVDAINLISPGNISANIVNNSLHIETANSYKFDFVPDNTITTDGSDGTSGLAGIGAGVEAPAVTTFGVYEGSNQTYNFKFTVPAPGVGQIGVDENIGLEVRNGAGELVKTLSLGNGYAAGDRLEIEEGLYVSFGQGTVNDGEDFSITARSDSDTSGFLVAAGINTFFKGAGAAEMTIRSEFFTDPMLLATAAGPDGEDNINAQRMAELAETSISGLDGKRAIDYFYEIGMEIGQQVMTRESRNTALQATVRELQTRRDQISGVDPNAEAAKLLIFERMFQAMSKFISVQDESLRNLMDVL